jgi:hypothetical protein
MEDQRREAADKEAAARRATDAQVLEDAERLIAAWNERQAKRMPMLFSPTIGAAIAAGHWFLWVRCGLPHHERDRPAEARSAPRCDSDQSHSGAIVPLLPAERAVRQARATVPDQHCRRNAGRAPAKSSRRRTIGVPRL